MLNTYISADNSTKIIIDDAVGGSIKWVRLSDNDSLEFIPSAEDKAEIQDAIFPGFKNGTILIMIAKALEKALTGGNN